MADGNLAKQVTLVIDSPGGRHTVETTSGMRLLEALSTIPGLEMQAPCGGNGVCGKCRVRAAGGLSPPGETEREFLSRKELDADIRLACLTTIIGNCRITLHGEEEKAHILDSAPAYQGKIDPPMRKTYLDLRPPTLEDRRPDDERLLGALKDLGVVGTPGSPSSHPAELHIEPSLLRKLPGILRSCDYRLTASHSQRKVYRLERGDTTAESYGIALDLGTTTVVSYLLHLRDGNLIDTVSGLNPQRVFGADIISRIAYAGRSEEKREMLGTRILELIGEMAADLAERNRIDLRDVSAMAAAGNTTMLHFFAGLDPRGIGEAPFAPASLGPAEYAAGELGLEGLTCPVFILPSISAYVGADIAAGIVSGGMLEDRELSLFVDLGTNGEIALGNRDKIYTCSTAAGPAFEGAGISCGMGGLPGAINSVRLADGDLSFTTIGGKSARGICGSGIIDTAAALVTSGTADYTGRILEAEESGAETNRSVLASGSGKNGEPAIRLAAGHRSSLADGHRNSLTESPGSSPDARTAEDAGESEGVLFTQKDLREVQTAKAAIAAGIETLLYEAGVGYQDISRVQIAGGFGSFINTDSAADIGLIPVQLSGLVESVGNTAGKGAVQALLSRETVQRFLELRGMSRYIELSTSSYFNKAYIEHMYFPVIK